MDAAETARETTPLPKRLGYQPALDGVRAIAVSLVVLFHYPWGRSGTRPTPFHGGFLGVDIFFVLSGFLITTLLLQEQAEFGFVSLKRFYAPRRALRLLPAFVVLWLFALVLHFVLKPGGIGPQTSGLVGSLFYVGNWVQIHHAGSLGIIENTWSLSIEEQFYFVWPLLLVLMLRGRLRLQTIGAITGVGALVVAGYRANYWYGHLSHASLVDAYFRLTVRRAGASTAGTLAQRAADWNRIYYGSDMRAGALLTGCTVAIALLLWLPRMSARARTRLPIAALLAIAGGALIIGFANFVASAWVPVWGYLALEVCVAVLIAGLVVAPNGAIARALSAAPLVWIGRRSYSIYLFHFIVFVYCKRSRIPLPPVPSFVFQIALIVVSADLVYRFVEMPMLRRKRHFEPEAVAPPAAAG